MSSTALIEAIVDGVLTGGVYALMAAGLTLIFGVMDIINIAQGVMVILGAYLSYELEAHAGISLLPGLLITIPVMFALGMAIEFCFMRRVRDQDRTQMSILVTYAVAIIIEGTLIAVFGVDYQQLTASYVNSSVHIFGFYLADIYLIGFGLALALLGGLYYGLYRTKFGRAVRASLQNRTAADLIGIDVNRVRMLSVGVGVAVTAVGGMVFGATNSLTPTPAMTSSHACWRSSSWAGWVRSAGRWWPRCSCSSSTTWWRSRGRRRGRRWCSSPHSW